MILQEITDASHRENPNLLGVFLNHLVKEAFTYLLLAQEFYCQIHNFVGVDL